MDKRCRKILLNKFWMGLSEYMKIDLDKLTPIEALVILNDLKRKANNS